MVKPTMGQKGCGHVYKYTMTIYELKNLLRLYAQSRNFYSGHKEHSEPDYNALARYMDGNATEEDTKYVRSLVLHDPDYSLLIETDDSYASPWKRLRTRVKNAYTIRSSIYIVSVLAALFILIAFVSLFYRGTRDAHEDVHAFRGQNSTSHIVAGDDTTDDIHTVAFTFNDGTFGREILSVYDSASALRDYYAEIAQGTNIVTDIVPVKVQSRIKGILNTYFGEYMVAYSYEQYFALVNVVEHLIGPPSVKPSFNERIMLLDKKTLDPRYDIPLDDYHVTGIHKKITIIDIDRDGQDEILIASEDALDTTNSSRHQE